MTGRREVPGWGLTGYIFNVPGREQCWGSCWQPQPSLIGNGHMEVSQKVLCGLEDVAKFTSFTPLQVLLLYTNSNIFGYLLSRYQRTESQLLRRQRRMPTGTLRANGRKELEEG